MERNGKKLKVLMCDGAGGYKGQVNGYKAFLNRIGAELKVTAADTPQQNARCERLNRTIFEMANAMRMTARFLPSLLYFCVNHAVHIWNRSVHCRSLITPYQEWTDRIPDVSKLIAFGSYGVSLVDKAKRDKGGHGDKGELVRYSGPGSREENYKVLKKNQQVMERDSVVWMEGIFDMKSATRTGEEIDVKSDSNGDGNGNEDKIRSESRDENSNDRGCKRSMRSNRGVPPLRMRVDPEISAIAHEVVNSLEGISDISEDQLHGVKTCGNGAARPEGKGPFTYKEVMKSHI